MMTNRGIIAGLLLVVLAAGTGSAEPSPALTNVTPDWAVSMDGYSLGWSFRPTQNIKVTRLGYYVVGASLTYDHTITIYASTGAVKAQGVVYGTLSGNPAPIESTRYAYVSIPEVQLDQDQLYVIAAHYVRNPTNWWDNDILTASAYAPASDYITPEDYSLQSTSYSTSPSMPNFNLSDYYQCLSANFKFEPAATEVAIEVPSSLNINGNGLIPVKIFGSADLDVSQIIVVDDDPTQTKWLRFNGLEVRVKSKGPQVSISDLNADGFDDLMCHFVDDPSAWVVGDSMGIVAGFLQDGTAIKGETPINVVNQ